MRPIVNKYREGKVKSTQHPYKGSERDPETGCLQTVGGILYPDSVPFV